MRLYDFAQICITKSEKCLNIVIKKIPIYIIGNKLENEYKIKINDKKTFIVDTYQGFEYLGYNFKFINNKLSITISSGNKRRRYNNIKKNKYLYRDGFIEYKRYFNSMNNYINSYKYRNKQ